MPWLICTNGDDRGLVEELAAGEGLVVGRTEGDIRLLNANVSRRHCCLKLEKNRLHVEDLGSTHGVKYRKKQYKGKTVKIKPKQTFSVGGDRFVFAATYEQYMDVVEELKGNFHKMDQAELKANYSKYIAEATRTRQFQQPAKSWLDRIRSLLKLDA